MVQKKKINHIEYPIRVEVELGQNTLAFLRRLFSVGADLRPKQQFNPSLGLDDEEVEALDLLDKLRNELGESPDKEGIILRGYARRFGRLLRSARNHKR